MRKLTIHKELFKTGQTGFAGSCTVVNTIQFHNLDSKTHIFNLSTHVRETKTVLDSGFWIPRRGF